MCKRQQAMIFHIPNRVSAGFTLVELLVVVAIIGILVGMIFPAVQAVRESARKTQCMNNLRQLGLAFHNYEGATSLIPPSRAADEFLTWPVYLMPFMEQNNLADLMDLRRPYFMQDAAVIQNEVPILICPSRSLRFSNVSIEESKNGPVGACGDYAGNAGSSAYFPGDLWSMFEAEVDGVINSGLAVDNPVENWLLPHQGRGRYRFADVSDGLSQTFFVGEKYVNVYGAQKGGGWGDGSIYNGDDPECAMRIGGFGMGLARSEDFVLSPGEFPIFGSPHWGLVHFLMGDGSVRGFSTSLDEETLYRLCSRNDGSFVQLD